MQFMNWMEKMAGVQSFLIILRVEEEEAVVVGAADAEGMTSNAMNVVNLDTLLGSAVHAVVHEAQEMEGDEVPVLIIGVVEVQIMVMIAGVIARVGEDLQDDVA